MDTRILKYLIKTIKYSKYIAPAIMAIVVIWGGTHGGDPIEGDPAV